VLEDDAVIGAVEILTRYEVGYTVPGAVVEQQSAEHRLLGFDRLGGNARRFDLRVLEDRSDDLSHDAPVGVWIEFSSAAIATHGLPKFTEKKGLSPALVSRKKNCVRLRDVRKFPPASCSDRSDSRNERSLLAEH